MDNHLTIEPEFATRAEPYRHELQVHCYRMLGSLQDAEDLVQETLLRAWQKREALREQTSLRAWLYKIATNACLDAIDRRPKRTLPLHYTSPSDPNEPPAPPILESIWLDPLPETLLADTSTSPEAHYSRRESVSLAFLAALQTLPARQRAVLILRDVLDWSAEECAQLLNMTVSAVNSTLHRARVTLSKRYQRVNPDTLPARSDEPQVRGLLQRYVQAWEAADIEEMLQLLREDATLLMPPSPTWIQGKANITVFAGKYFWGSHPAGQWRLIATAANDAPAFAFYERIGTSGRYRAFSIQLLEIRDGKITREITFMNPALFRHFGLPEETDV